MELLRSFKCFFHQETFPFETTHCLCFDLLIKMYTPLLPLPGWALVLWDIQREADFVPSTLGCFMVYRKFIQILHLGTKQVDSVAKPRKIQAEWREDLLHWPQNVSRGKEVQMGKGPVLGKKTSRPLHTGDSASSMEMCAAPEEGCHGAPPETSFNSLPPTCRSSRDDGFSECGPKCSVGASCSCCLICCSLTLSKNTYQWVQEQTRTHKHTLPSHAAGTQRC